MCKNTAIGAILVASLLGIGVIPAPAEIVSIAGSASAAVQEFRFGAVGDSDHASDDYPTTSATLPLQVIAQLVALPDETAAAIAASQFADPLTLNQSNPEEFAIDLALSSITANTRYTAQAVSEELRDVLFTQAELGQPNGATVHLTGRLFIDGALTVFSAQADRDLTGANVAVTVTVVRRSRGRRTRPSSPAASDLLGAPAARLRRPQPVRSRRAR